MVADDQDFLFTQIDDVVARGMPRRPDHLEGSLANRDLVTVANKLVGTGDRAVQPASHPGRTHAVGGEALDWESMHREEGARFGPRGHGDLCVTEHAVYALSFELMQIDFG